MTVYTPRGLRLRVKADHAFALMARLYPKVDAFKVLKMTEGLELIPSLLGTVTGLVCFAFRLDPFFIGVFAFMATGIGGLITSYGFYIFPGIPTLGVWYSYFHGFGLYSAIIAVTGLLLLGWKAVIFFFIGRILATLIDNHIFGFIEMKLMHKLTGLAYTSSERNFFNAYRLHANKLGKDLNFTVTDEEVREENWKPVYEDLVMKWPKVASRCDNK
ncbi:hypothetical protein KKF55_06120 [Patescibacteria group bacterium]|nr:hypothetical protein [Patescibacteria group bacterium]